MHGAHNTGKNACILSAKNARALVHARLCNGAEASLPWKLWIKLLRTYFESCASITCASCRLSFAARPPAGSTKSVAWRYSLNTSVWIHASSWRGRRCSVAQASFDYPRRCRPHLFYLWVALRVQAWPWERLHQKFNFRHFFRGPFSHCNMLHHTASHCITLHHAAKRCNIRKHTATHCNTLQHATACCNTLQPIATLCSTLQHTATYCHPMWHAATRNYTLQHETTRWNTMQHNATASWLQHAATHYKATQHCDAASHCNML